MTPSRLLDTRPATSVNYSGPNPGPMAPVDRQITGQVGIPVNAVAAALNVTLTESDGAGYVQVYPTGQWTPGSSSNLNAESSGQTIPNSSSGAGYVQAAPAGALAPGATSNLNVVRAGQTIPNLVIVPVSAAGEVDLFTQHPTELSGASQSRGAEREAAPRRVSVAGPSVRPTADQTSGSRSRPS
jgi:hypothetical protein